MPTITAPSVSKATKAKFELPVLAPLPSLTAGTNIPPPPDSPIEEKPPALLPKTSAEELSKVAEGAANGNGNGVGNGITTSISTNGDAYTGRGRSSVNVPPSPVSSTRPSSIRRFLSRKSMYNSYSTGSNGNGSVENLGDTGSTFSSPMSKKRSSSWFRRFTSGGSPEPPNKRTSIVYEEKEKQGPPPPQLPELVKSDEGSLGGEDMFKRIN
jgi:hypothetical protein